MGPLNASVNSSWSFVITEGGHPLTMLYVSPVAPGAVLPLCECIAAVNTAREGGLRRACCTATVVASCPGVVL